MNEDTMRSARRPNSPENRQEDREAERQKRQDEQLRAVRKRESIILFAFITVILAAVIVVSAVTKDTQQELLKEPEKTTEKTTESTTEKETVINVIGKNETQGTVSEQDAAEIPETSEIREAEHEAEITEPEITAPPETEPSFETEAPETAAPETPAPETAAPVTYETVPSSVNISNSILIPSWITQHFLDISPKNRPGIALPQVNDIVIHWVANPGSTALGNWEYFQNLANPEVNHENISASSHFIVGLEGEIIQCIPVEEVAYANQPRNYDTISIEVCHPDWGGKYNDTTYASVIRLAAYLCEQYGLNADHVIRHHDVSGKDCPKYYVEHPEAWEALRTDITIYISKHPDIEHEFP
ncbi:MAG: N-acetylmuramoyl-L-alanine amidase [Lachnospiraceae bacterium]|nr:N-acetylmuramoyl-L-alanine amidase [Lachnospiraceae bacterium]